MQPKIHFRIAVCPVDLSDPVESFYCDIECTEADIQTVDERHGLDDFIEKFIKPGIWAMLDRFQQPYADVDDLIHKTVDAGRDVLPRSIEFFREKAEMSKRLREAQRAA